MAFWAVKLRIPEEMASTLTQYPEVVPLPLSQNDGYAWFGVPDEFLEKHPEYVQYKHD
jgi:hypothetical protein